MSKIEQGFGWLQVEAGEFQARVEQAKAAADSDGKVPEGAAGTSKRRAPPPVIDELKYLDHLITESAFCVPRMRGMQHMYKRQCASDTWTCCASSCATHEASRGDLLPIHKDCMHVCHATCETAWWVHDCDWRNKARCSTRIVRHHATVASTSRKAVR